MSIVLTIPNSAFSPNTTILSAATNANNSAISTWAAQFATGTGYVFTTPASNATAVNINGVTSQSVDILDVNLASAGTNVFKIDSIGQGVFTAGAAGSAPLTVTSVASASVATLTINMGSSQSKAGLLVSGAASITGNLAEFDLTSGGTNIFKLDSKGQGSFSAGATTSIPLTLNMIASQSVDGLQINGAATITGNYFNVINSSANGVLALNHSGALILTAAGGGGGASLDSSTFSMAASTSGDGLIGLASGKTLTFSDNGSTTNIARIAKAGMQAAPTINSTNTLGYVPPAYTHSGAATASTAHIVVDTFTGNGGTVNITLGGAAVFANGAVCMYVNVTSGTAAVYTGNISNSLAFTSTVNGATYFYVVVGS